MTKSPLDYLQKKVAMQETVIAILTKALKNTKNADPRPDLSMHKYFDAFRWLEDYVDDSLAKVALIQHDFDHDNNKEE